MGAAPGRINNRDQEDGGKRVDEWVAVDREDTHQN
jgi:hypothetical protein